MNMCLFEIHEESDGTFMISPMSYSENGKYLIQASTREEAERIKHRLDNHDLESPIDNDAFEYLRDSISAERVTQIFALR